MTGVMTPKRLTVGWGNRLKARQVNKIIFIDFRERKGEGERETSVMRIIDQLRPAHPTLGSELATEACALDWN